MHIKILVVDDEQISTEIIEKVLSQILLSEIAIEKNNRQILIDNIEIHVCYNGTEALEKLEKSKYHIVISDVVMPGMSGFEIWKRAKKMNINSNTPFLFISGHYSSDYIDSEYEMEEFHFLTKPFHFQDLLDIVSKIIIKECYEFKDKNIHNTSAPDKSPDHEEKLTGDINRKSEINKPIELIELSKLTRGIIHDLKNNNLLTKHLAEELHEVLQENASNPDTSIELVNEILKRCKLISNDISKLRNISTHSKPKAELINVNDIIQEILSYSVLRNITTDLNLKKDLPEILSDNEMVTQILNNLIQNAIQSMPKGGTLGITTIEHEIKNKFVKITISDTGCGISENDFAKIFDLDYTTKREGYGLGLFLVKELTSMLNGKVIFTSKINAGTTFHVALPLNKQETVL